MDSLFSETEREELSRPEAKFTLIVNVPFCTTRPELMKCLIPFGSIELAMVVCNRKHRHPTREWTATSGFGFVRFTCHQSACRAIVNSRYGLLWLKGCRIRASWARKDTYTKDYDKMRRVTDCGESSSALVALSSASPEEPVRPKIHSHCLTVPSPEWICSICTVNVVYQPKMTPCGHMFCGDCIDCWCISNLISPRSCRDSSSSLTFSNAESPSSSCWVATIPSPSSSSDSSLLSTPAASSTGVPFCCPTCQHSFYYSQLETVSPAPSSSDSSGGGGPFAFIHRQLLSLPIRCPHGHKPVGSFGDRPVGSSAAAVVVELPRSIDPVCAAADNLCSWVGTYADFWEHIERCPAATLYSCASAGSSSSFMTAGWSGEGLPSPPTRAGAAVAKEASRVTPQEEVNFDLAPTTTGSGSLAAEGGAKRASAELLFHHMHGNDGVSARVKDAVECSDPMEGQRLVLVKPFTIQDNVQAYVGDVVELLYNSSDARWLYGRFVWHKGQPCDWIPKSIVTPLPELPRGAECMASRIGHENAGRLFISLHRRMWQGGIGPKVLMQQPAGQFSGGEQQTEDNVFVVDVHPKGWVFGIVYGKGETVSRGWFPAERLRDMLPPNATLPTTTTAVFPLVSGRGDPTDLQGHSAG
eukprot:GHVS01019039.1.p1 GENE.GHVS01019039.1~~GHVS01019039.1.p1  ORF type:complete len:641 (+),score=94.49 GHVS01019039.1:451-2373(+)